MTKLNLYYVREMQIRPIEESLDRIVSAPDRETAYRLWAEATAHKGDVFSIDMLPEPSKMGVMDWQTMRLIERL